MRHLPLRVAVTTISCSSTPGGAAGGAVAGADASALARRRARLTVPSEASAQADPVLGPRSRGLEAPRIKLGQPFARERRLDGRALPETLPKRIERRCLRHVRRGDLAAAPDEENE